MRFRHVEPDNQYATDRPSRGLIVYDDNGTPRKWLHFFEHQDGSIGVRFCQNEGHLLHRLDKAEQNEARRIG